MRSIDEEWRRLTELYTQMSEGELEALANQAYDLTDMAREVLRGEISRRGLHIQLLDQPRPIESPADIERAATFDPSELDLVCIGRAFNLQDARWYKNALDNGGVPSYFGPDNVEDVEKLISALEAEKAKALRRGYEAGIECRVPSQYQQRAFQVLANAPPLPDVDTAPDDERDYAAICPRCRASDITFQGLESEDGADPDVDSKYNWRCDACGYEWTDDGVEEQGVAST